MASSALRKNSRPRLVEYRVDEADSSPTAWSSSRPSNCRWRGSEDGSRPADVVLRMADPGEIDREWEAADSSPAWHATFPGNAYVMRPARPRRRLPDHLRPRQLPPLPEQGDAALRTRRSREPALAALSAGDGAADVSLLRGFEALHASAIPRRRASSPASRCGAGASRPSRPSSSGAAIPSSPTTCWR